MSGRLRIAIQSKGRMAEGSLALLDRTGLKFRRGRDDLLMRVEDLPIDVLSDRNYEDVGKLDRLKLGGYGYRWIRLCRGYDR